MRVAGMMSGTSGDGIDVCIVDITTRSDTEGQKPSLDIVAFDTVPYTKEDRECLFHLFSGKASVRDICQGNFRFGRLFGEALLRVCDNSGTDVSSIDLVGSHGQTIWHDIDSTTGVCTSTLQIGESAVIAEVTGCNVVSDFRVGDIAAGGHGAPLTSTLDHLLYHPPSRLSGVEGGVRALQNIGGIGNVTFLLSEETLDDNSSKEPVLAFDTGPGNVLIDWCISKASNGTQTYDKDGTSASTGTVSTELLDEMMLDPFFSREPPKTTGRELFSPSWAQRFWDKGLKIGCSHNDLVATFSMLTVTSIVHAYEKFCPRAHLLAEVVTSGGGAHNDFLMSNLQRMLNERMGRVVPVRVLQDICVGINADEKEAALFALLAWLHIHRRPGNVPSSTGAIGSRVLGKLTPAFPPRARTTVIQ